MNEECVVRKLIADGDGSGDDRRFTSLLSAVLKLTNDPEMVQSMLPRILKTLDTAETAMQKQLLIESMNEQQIEEYAQLEKEIEQQIVEANEKMSLAKRDLETAKAIRRNKEEYELLAKMITKVPSRQETNSKLYAIEQELKNLHEKQRTLECKLVDRRNHLHAFSIILANFNRFLREESDDTTNSSSPENGTSTSFKGMK